MAAVLVADMNTYIFDLWMCHVVMLVPLYMNVKLYVSVHAVVHVMPSIIVKTCILIDDVHLASMSRMH